MPPVVTRTRIGEVSQGTIFSCAVAEEYAGCAVYGLIITARCDIAQSKVPIYNYLPIVTLDDWVHRDGKDIFCDRAEREVVGGLNGQLKQANLSTSILQVHPPRDVLNTLFGDEAAGQSAKIKKNFEKLVEKYELCKEVSSSVPEELKVESLEADFSGLSYRLFY